jgi:hypothetical protein
MQTMVMFMIAKLCLDDLKAFIFTFQKIFLIGYVHLFKGIFSTFFDVG